MDSNDRTMNELIPFMDLHPELKLVPTTCTSVNIRNFQKKFDYVQDFNRKSDNESKEYFHLLVKDGKYGIMLHTSSFLSKIDEVALPAIYDSIEFIHKIDKSFGAIVSKEGKFGLSFWEHGSFFNRTHNVPIEYDVIENLDNKRIKAIKGETIVYFDITGHILK